MTLSLLELIAGSRRLSDRTKKAYSVGVQSFLASLGDTSPTPLAVERWATELQARGVQPQTVNNYLAGVKWASARFYAMDLGPDFAAQAEQFKVERQVRPQHALTAAEAARLIAACEGENRSAVRDRTIIILGLRAGLRRNEIAKARWQDLAGNVLTVVGKGGHDETVELDEQTMAQLAVWRKMTLGPRTVPLYGTAPRIYLFTAARPDLEAAAERALTPDGVYKIIVSRARAAGIRNVSPHTLRHTFATLLAVAGLPPWRIQSAMRHRGGALNATTAGYVHDPGGPPGALLGNFDKPLDNPAPEDEDEEP